jgi:phosphatidate cytidylyltransferase
MLRTRLWMGAILVALAAGVLIIDQGLAPWYPFLFILVMGLAEAACFELLQLLPAAYRPAPWLSHLAVAVLVVLNWVPHVGVLGWRTNPDPWPWIAGSMACILVAAFLQEMATFREPGASVVRIALVVWLVGYLGLLPSFFVQLRWIGAAINTNSTNKVDVGTIALALAIFVPKCGDIGAYFTGRLLGRHRMTPLLSPNKTWEGAIGGLIASTAVAIGLNRMGPVLSGGIGVEIGFGLAVGVAGMLGDLAESLIKRDCRRKDASDTVPGFGGVLDVVDAVLFAAPLAYWWCTTFGPGTAT